jgi:hypothetical protein
VAAEELTGEVLRALWQQSSMFVPAQTPVSHARRIMVHAIAGRHRRLVHQPRKAAVVASLIHR